MYTYYVYRISSVSCFVIILLLFCSGSTAKNNPSSECPQVENMQAGSCYNNKSEAVRQKVIAIFVILIVNIIGLLLRFLPFLVYLKLPQTRFLHPDGNYLFFIVKAFAFGIMLATVCMHVSPNSSENLKSYFLPENPWRVFHFMGVVDMISNVFIFMGGYFNKMPSEITAISSEDENASVHPLNPDNYDIEMNNSQIITTTLSGTQSVVVGLYLGASRSVCIIKHLLSALCFHQMFIGMRVGGFILQAQYGLWMKTVMVLFFSTTTPFCIALGIGLSKVYSYNDPIAFMTIGILGTLSAFLLKYTTLVDSLSAEFVQKSVSLKALAFVFALLGVGSSYLF